ncbi:hypothetical protein [Kocuria sp.]|uniref:hypothetical protein n=1 Tax=Kocuria sp. TaxID=1871328 RepID=UPI0026E01CBB|nr:hypothetical protein [Kocuria sp.]MDO5618642.1 hypothetical protein [Kocuria sp.]
MTPSQHPPEQPQDSPLPQWGRMRPVGHAAANPAAAADATKQTPQPSAQTVAARRRAVRGLSLALIMLGTLLGFGLAALGRPWMGAIGLLPVLTGLAGYAAVHWGVHAALRPPHVAPSRPGRSWWWLPATFGILGLAAVGAAFGTDAATPETGSPWTVVWLVTAATLLTAAGLGCGLVAVSRLTVDDDDDAPLRKVDWDHEYPQRYPNQPRQPRPLYDSSWITGQSGSSHSHTQPPQNDPDQN